MTADQAMRALAMAHDLGRGDRERSDSSHRVTGQPGPGDDAESDVEGQLGVDL